MDSYAEAEHEARLVMQIGKAAQKKRHWRAAKWKLERTFPRRYGEREVETLTAEELHIVLRWLSAMFFESMSSDEERKRVAGKMRDELADTEELVFQHMRSVRVRKPLRDDSIQNEIAARQKRRQAEQELPRFPHIYDDDDEADDVQQHEGNDGVDHA